MRKSLSDFWDAETELIGIRWIDVWEGEDDNSYYDIVTTCYHLKTRNVEWVIDDSMIDPMVILTRIGIGNKDPTIKIKGEKEDVRLLLAKMGFATSLVD